MSDKGLVAQKDRSKNICNFLINSKLKVAVSVQTSAHFTPRLELLEKYWAKFEDYHPELLFAFEKFSDDEYFTADLYLLTQDAYLAAKAEFLEDRARVIGSSGVVNTTPTYGYPLILSL